MGSCDQDPGRELEPEIKTQEGPSTNVPEGAMGKEIEMRDFLFGVFTVVEYVSPAVFLYFGLVEIGLTEQAAGFFGGALVLVVAPIIHLKDKVRYNR